jgi:hypothetical protein
MVKICLDCHYVNAGGYRCCECDGRLVMVTDPEAQDLPPEVWKTQRVDYGARRGMIYRFLAIFIGASVGLYGFREAFVLASPYNIIFCTLAVITGLAVWRFLHQAATRGVRVWVLAKGKVHRGRLFRAVLSGFIPDVFKRRVRSR